MQQALATLLTELDIENTNLDKATQTVHDLFAMSTKVLDQFGRSEAYGHLICRKATMIDIGLDPAKAYLGMKVFASEGDGVLGREFQTKPKKSKEKNKDFVPEIYLFGRRDYSNNLKKKVQSMTVTNRNALILLRQWQIGV